jgi:hypothetical protein
MSHGVSRRQVLQSIGAIAVVQALRPAFAIRGRPVEILITSASSSTVRISIVAVDGTTEIPDDGALTDRAWPAAISVVCRRVRPKEWRHCLPRRQ